MDQYLNKIICGDCLEVMQKLPDKSIDLTVTSPPYNLGNNHHTGIKNTQAYADNFPEDQYQKQQIEILNEIHRITKDDGSILYNHKNRIKKGRQITPYEWLLKTKWIAKQELVWFNRSQNFDKIRFYPMTERVYWLAKSPDTKLFNTINHHDLFQWNAVGTRGQHTRSFPEQMATDLISCFPEANVVFDPYMGSGTVAVASQKMGKNFIGIEISREYCDIAEERLKNLQPSLI